MEFLRFYSKSLEQFWKHSIIMALFECIKMMTAFVLDVKVSAGIKKTSTYVFNNDNRVSQK